MTVEWKKLFGVLGDEVVEVEVYAVEGGYIVRRGCLREFVPGNRLSMTREEAEQRLARLGPRRTV